MRTRIAERVLTIVLLAGVVGGFGSGIASCGRHARDHRGAWSERCNQQKAAVAAPSTTTTPSAAAPAAPAPAAPDEEKEPEKETTTAPQE